MGYLYWNYTHYILIHSTETNQVLNSNEVRDIRLSTAHDYFVDNVLKPGYIKDLMRKVKISKIIYKNWI